MNMTAGEAAILLGVDRKTVGRWCRAGKLSGAVRNGRAWDIPAEVVRKLSDAKLPCPGETEQGSVRFSCEREKGHDGLHRRTYISELVWSG